MSGMIASLSRKLRIRFPGVKVTVRRGKLPDDEFANTDLDEAKGVFVITIDQEIDESFACFILPHEWAHAVSYHIDTREHGPAFWTAYKRSYEIYARWATQTQ